MRTTAEKEAPVKQTQQTNGRPERQEYVTPECNIFETKDGYMLEAEMPGVNKSGLEVTLENNELTIVGHRSEENFAAQPIFRERHVFELDPAIDTTKISAKMDQGVLTLTLPKSEKVKPRRITVD
jgi:HSP20 family protein